MSQVHSPCLDVGQNAGPSFVNVPVMDPLSSVIINTRYTSYWSDFFGNKVDIILLLLDWITLQWGIILHNSIYFGQWWVGGQTMLQVYLFVKWTSLVCSSFQDHWPIYYSFVHLNMSYSDVNINVYRFVEQIYCIFISRLK